MEAFPTYSQLTQDDACQRWEIAKPFTTDQYQQNWQVSISNFSNILNPSEIPLDLGAILAKI